MSLGDTFGECAAAAFRIDGDASSFAAAVLLVTAAKCRDKTAVPFGYQSQFRSHADHQGIALCSAAAWAGGDGSGVGYYLYGFGCTFAVVESVVAAALHTADHVRSQIVVVEILPFRYLDKLPFAETLPFH